MCCCGQDVSPCVLFKYSPLHLGEAEPIKARFLGPTETVLWDKCGTTLPVLKNSLRSKKQNRNWIGSTSVMR